MVRPDYQNSIACLPNSVLKHFGVCDGRQRRTLPLMDRALEQDYQNIVVLLLDAMGTQTILDNLAPDGFFARHLAGSFHSVFPPTTVAATTSAATGLQPVEHSWLGWDCYYPGIDKNVTVFRNTESGTDLPAAEFPVAETFCPYRSVVELLREQGCQAYTVTPFVEPFPGDFPTILDTITGLCRKPGKKYIYSYWKEPDSTMHDTGCRSPQTRQIMAQLERQVEAFAGALQDTLLIITADHGHIDAGGVALEDYPRLRDCLLRAPSIEPRAVNFFVKPGMEDRFCREFTAEFGENFLLLSRQQVKQLQLFGEGVEGGKSSKCNKI